jgi:UDP-N-acetylmuramate-alanine ligase
MRRNALGIAALAALYLCESTRPGDLVLTLGAGDVGQLGAELLTRLNGPRDQSNRR